MRLWIPKSIQRINLLYYTLIIVVLGVPLWWYTTDTYRAALPHQEIRALKERNVLLTVPLDICFDQNDVSHKRVEDLITSVKPYLLSRSPKSRVIFDIAPSIPKRCSSKHLSVILTNEVTRPSKAEIASEGMKVSLEKMDRMLADVGGDIVNYLDLEFIEKHISTNQADQSVMNAMAAATSYNILVTVVNPNPATITLPHDLGNAAQEYLEPFLGQLKGLASFTYQTQVVRYVTLPQRPMEQGDGFYITESSLPHLITPIESKLGTSTSNDINLIVFLVEPAFSPLSIKRSDGSLQDLATFLSPQFGAVLLYSTKDKERVDGREVFGILLPQLKQLLGLRASNNSRITAREHFLLRSRTALSHILRSIDTLNSLISLVDSIPNMVIGDHIAEQIARSIAGIEQACDFLEAGDLSSALTHASLARDAAEKSFSDPSILALLYFPDDQKFAIYIPLFLPVGLPLLVSYLELLKEWRRKKVRSD